MNRSIDRRRADEIYRAFYMNEDVARFTIKELEATLGVYQKDSKAPIYHAVEKQLAVLKKKKLDKEKFERKIIISLLIIFVGGIIGGIFMDVLFP